VKFEKKDRHPVLHPWREKYLKPTLENIHISNQLMFRRTKICITILKEQLLEFFFNKRLSVLPSSF
jgi:hypothetical protein